MTRPLVAALRRKPVPSTPVWIMRQAGRHLPEYRRLRERYSFQEAVADPSVAAEITLQPVRRYGMDAAVIFADIMTPLEALGVDVVFDPGPGLRPHTAAEVAALPPLDADRVANVAETIGLVRESVPDEVAVVGFAGAPFTLLAYLLEGGGSKDFMAVRTAVRADPPAAEAALVNLALSMNTYLRTQIEAGADVVQLFDSWAGQLAAADYAAMAASPATVALGGLAAPRIYFAPGAGHVLEQQRRIGADGFGVDWRVPLAECWDRLGNEVAIQGNLDPALLLTDPGTIRRVAHQLLDSVTGRPGHIFNLGHGIDRSTPPAHVAALVAAVREHGA